MKSILYGNSKSNSKNGAEVSNRVVLFELLQILLCVIIFN